MGVLDKPLTPCIGICSTTNMGDEICRGCKRTAKQVLEWNSYSNELKIQVMKVLDGISLKPQQKPVCKYCKGDDVVRDLNGYWNMEKQEWDYDEADVIPNGWCRTCDDETTIEWEDV